MEKKLVFARTLAGILGIALIIAFVVIWNDHKTITDLRYPLEHNITAQQDIIRQDCSATDLDSKQRCGDDLQHLNDLLRELSNTRTASSTTSVNGNVQGSVSGFQIEKLPTK